jgi:4-hydroxythreonine-4-phosphate dehydrogenase
VIGSAEILHRLSSTMGLDVPLQAIDSAGAAACAFPDALPVLDVPLPARVTPGRADPANAAATLASIERAADLVMTGHAAAMVTGPIAKATLAAAGFPHPGHTEFLGALANAHGLPARPVMLLASRELNVVPVTIHIALKDVPAALTSQAIIESGAILAAALRRFFGIETPRIAVAGLNPHAGESGVMGHEEETIIRPAIQSLRAQGVDANGPHPADTLFHERARRTYDAVLAMYHDQALIPVKTLAFDSAVNVTLGLPFIRTSPDHGTAFDIAGRGIARPESTLCALQLAAGMAARQAESKAQHGIPA